MTVQWTLKAVGQQFAFQIVERHYSRTLGKSTDFSTVVVKGTRCLKKLFYLFSIPSVFGDDGRNVANLCRFSSGTILPHNTLHLSI